MPSAGAETSPTTGSPSSISAISVAQTGTPRTKFLVPSMGSITQWRFDLPVVPNSSPVTASRGRARARCERIASSAALSASETGVRSGLVSTTRSTALKRERVNESTESAITWARRRSSLYVITSEFMLLNLSHPGPRGPIRVRPASGRTGSRAG